MHDEDPQFTNTLPSGGASAAGRRAASGAVEGPLVTALEPGDVIGRYRIRERVGEGGMGVVYAAEDPELGRVVAIKLLRPVQGDDAESQQKRMLREAQALARVSHRNLVMVFDVGSLRGRVWIAMEYVAGDTLETWLSRDRRTWSEIIAVFAEAGRGLAAVHAAGLVHRDFKPGNVIVRADGTVQVLDFGLAARAGDAEEQMPSDPDRAPPDLDALAATLTTTGAFMGTPAYMAPEQFMMLTTDGRADQFSVCVALYEALYGHRPFTGRDLAQLMASTMAGLPGLPAELPGVPLAVRQVIATGLATDPAARFADMNALVEALEHTRTPARKESPGWRRFALGMIAGGGVLALGTYIWLSRADDEVATAPTAAVPAAPSVAPAPAKADVAAPVVPTPATAVLPSVIDPPAEPDIAVVEPEVVATPDAVTRTPAADPRALPQTATTVTPVSPSALPSLSDLEEREEPRAEDAKKPAVEAPIEKPAEPPAEKPAEAPAEPAAAEPEG